MEIERININELSLCCLECHTVILSHLEDGREVSVIISDALQFLPVLPVSIPSASVLCELSAFPEEYPFYISIFPLCQSEFFLMSSTNPSS